MVHPETQVQQGSVEASATELELRNRSTQRSSQLEGAMKWTSLKVQEHVRTKQPLHVRKRGGTSEGGVQTGHGP